MAKRWKEIEMFASRLLGGRRRPGSGAWANRHDSEGADDMIDQPLIYLEVKHTRKAAVPGRVLWKDAVKKAEAVEKIPIVFIHEKYTAPEEGWIWIRPEDLLEVALIYEIVKDKKAKKEMAENEEAPGPISTWKLNFAERLTRTLQRIAPVLGSQEALGQDKWEGARRVYQNKRTRDGFNISHDRLIAVDKRVEDFLSGDGLLCPDCNVKLIEGPEVSRCPRCRGIFPTPKR